MGRHNYTLVLVALGVCTVIFTYLSILVINALEPASMPLVWAIAISTFISTCILQALVIVWTIAELSDRLHHYKVEQKRREIELQALIRRRWEMSRF